MCRVGNLELFKLMHLQEKYSLKLWRGIKFKH